MSSRWVRSVLLIKLGSKWEDVKKLYRDARIPIYVRHFLAERIETEIDLSPDHFLIELQQKCVEIPSFLVDGSSDFASMLAAEPQLLLNRLRWCLDGEKRIVREDGESWRHRETAERGVDDKIANLRGTIEGIKDLLSKMNIVRTAGAEGTAYVPLQNELLSYQQAQTLFYGKVVELLAELTILVRGYFKFTVDFWEYERKKGLIGYKEMSSKVPLIEADAQGLQVALLDLKGLVEQDEAKAFGLSSLTPYVSELQGDLLKISLYTEDSVVIRKGCKSPLKVGVLSIRGNEISSPKFSIKLTGKLVSEITESKRGVQESSNSSSSGDSDLEDSGWQKVGVLSGNVFPTKEGTNGRRRSGNSQAGNESGNHLRVCMENFMLENLDGRRLGQSQQEFVTDKLVYVLLTCDIQIDGSDFKFQKLSIPHVVTTNNSQNSQAWATILRSYGFCNFPETPETSEFASWERILDVIQKFYTDKTELTLNEQQLNHLTQRGNYSLGRQVELKNFFKKTLFKFQPELEGKKIEKYSYWRWFYGTIKLIEQMRERNKKDGSEGKEWITSMDKYFMGFICKSEAERLLTNARKGTFLLRFSDSAPSAISVVVNIQDGIPRSVQPFTKMDFPLSAKIMKISDAECLYPNVAKSRVFANVSAPEEVAPNTNRQGYERLVPTLTFNDPEYTLYANGIADLVNDIFGIGNIFEMDIQY